MLVKMKSSNGGVVNKGVQAALFALLLIGGILTLYPLLYALLGSMATNQEFYNTVFVPIPHSATTWLRNYKTLFDDSAIWVSMAVTLGKIIFQLIITIFTSVLGGFVFAKLRFPLKRMFFIILISSMMIPGVAMMIPNYIWMARFPLLGGNDFLGNGGSGFLDNPMIHVLTGWLNVYNIFLCRQAFVALGNEMNESAKIDGASFFRIVFMIYMPLIAPIVAVIFLNLFLGIWNDYMTNFIYLSDAEMWQTIGYSVVRVMDIYGNPQRLGGADYPVVFAVALISMIPPIIVYICVQKQFTEGLTMGAVKG